MRCDGCLYEVRPPSDPLLLWPQGPPRLDRGFICSRSLQRLTCTYEAEQMSLSCLLVEARGGVGLVQLAPLSGINDVISCEKGSHISLLTCVRS